MKKPIQFQLNGINAIAAILFMIVLSVIGSSIRTASFQDDGEKAIVAYLQTEYLRRNQDSRSGLNISRLAEEQAEELAQESLALRRVVLKSASYRKDGDEYYARVEVQVDGKAPPDGEPIRYLLMQHSMLLGWTVRRDSTAFSYWTALW